MLLIHASLKGFGIDTPLRDANGKTLRNFKRITLPTGASGQWAELRITPASPELFSVSVRMRPAARAKTATEPDRPRRCDRATAR